MKLVQKCKKSVMNLAQPQEDQEDVDGLMLNK